MGGAIEALEAFYMMFFDPRGYARDYIRPDPWKIIRWTVTYIATLTWVSNYILWGDNISFFMKVENALLVTVSAIMASFIVFFLHGVEFIYSFVIYMTGLSVFLTLGVFFYFIDNFISAHLGRDSNIRLIYMFGGLIFMFDFHVNKYSQMISELLQIDEHETENIWFLGTFIVCFLALGLIESAFTG